MDDAGRNGDEISAPNSDGLSTIPTVVEPKLSFHAETGNTAIPVMVPAYPGAAWNPKHACRAIRQKIRFDSSKAPPLSYDSPRRTRVRHHIRKLTYWIEPVKLTPYVPKRPVSDPAMEDGSPLVLDWGGLHWQTETIWAIWPRESSRARLDLLRLRGNGDIPTGQLCSENRLDRRRRHSPGDLDGGSAGAFSIGNGSILSAGVKPKMRERKYRVASSTRCRFSDLRNP